MSVRIPGPPSNARLTVLKVQKLSKPGRYGDGNGLYLVVDPSGARRWVLRVVVQGRRRDIGLGSARLVALADARDMACAYRRIAREGGDPIAERRKSRRVVPTFAQAAEAVFQERSAAWKNVKHRAQWLSTLNMYAIPVIGNRRVDQIDTPDILKILSPLWLTKAETARRLKQRLHAVFDWARASGHRTGDNPVSGVEKGLPKMPGRKGHFAAMPYAEVPAFLQRLRETDSLGEVSKLALAFLILTATRTNEVLCARWSEIDLGHKVWTISAERMKAGREHRVPLPPRCLELLAKAQAASGNSPYVFRGREAQKPLTNMVFLMALRRMEVAVTVHGFRSSFRDWAAERTNFAREVCEMALAHAIEDKTEAAYRRGDLFEKRRSLMNAWANYLTAETGTVVQLHAG